MSFDIAFIDGDLVAPEANWIFRGRFGTEEVPDIVMEYVDKRMESLRTCVFQRDNLIAVQGHGNFREVLHPGYKKSTSRAKSRSNREPWFSNLRKYISEMPDVVLSHGAEADDLLRMWSCQAQPETFVVISSDKDLDCIPGDHVMPKGGFNSYVISEEQALHHYWMQILTGDGVDNIPGLPQIGPARANAILRGAVSEEEYLSKVIGAYRAVHGDEWGEHLIFNGRLIHMWRHPGDFFRI